MWPPKYINQVGVEMEGGWERRPRGLKSDGSVRVIANYIGEVSPGPFKPTAMIKHIKTLYPDITNQSCGFHIHVSTKRMDEYTTLMRKEYNDLFLATFEEWAKHQDENMNLFRKRLAGENDFCRKRFIPQYQWNEASRHHDRYTQLNFCWSRHGTLECRLFPMFVMQDTTISAYKTFVDITDDFIAQNIKSEQEPIILAEEFDGAEEFLVA